MIGSLNRPKQPLPDDAPHVLVVDDDSRIRTLLGRFLADNGYRATLAANAEEARKAMVSFSFDAAILDVMMPGESGFSLAGSIKKLLDLPIMMLTAKTESADRIEGLEIGADDYLTKPFEPRELVLRLRNLLKRRVVEPAEPPRVAVTFGSFRFDLTRDELSDGQQIIRLTDRELQLLKEFATAPDGTVSRDALIGNDGAVGERTVDVQINRLRRKIETDPANPLHLVTVRGIGYRLKFDAEV